MKFGSRWITLLKVAVAVGIIALLFGSDRLSLTSFRALGTRWPWWLAAFAGYGVVLALAATRWRVGRPGSRSVRQCGQHSHNSVDCGQFATSALLCPLDRRD